MPLYDYRCDACGDFRAFRPMSEAQASQPCPHCSALAPRRMSAPFLAGASSAGWLTQPGGAAPGRGSWRSACGFGCTHANCRAA
jgi:putative FmdB family regulatory protein